MRIRRYIAINYLYTYYLDKLFNLLIRGLVELNNDSMIIFYDTDNDYSIFGILVYPFDFVMTTSIVVFATLGKN